MYGWRSRGTEWTSRRVDQGIRIEWAGMDFASRHLYGESPQWGLETTDWWEGTAPATPTMEADRGVRPLGERLAPRQVTWAGLLEARHTSVLLEEMNTLRSARGDLLRVWEGPADLWREMTVRRLQVLVTAISDRHAEYTVTVQADNPITYSVDEVAVSGTVRVTNLGDHVSHPLVTVKGPATSPVVHVGGRSVAVGQSLTASQTAIVDCSDGALWVAGARRLPLIAQWPSIAAGSSADIRVTGGGTATVRRVSAWI